MTKVFEYPWDRFPEDTVRNKVKEYFYHSCSLPFVAIEEGIPEWYQSIYAEVVLFQCLIGENNDGKRRVMESRWKEVSPFGVGTPPLSQFLGKEVQGAVALFPTCEMGGGGHSALYRLYLFRGLPLKYQDHKKYLSFTDEFLGTEDTCYVMDTYSCPLHSKLDGDSWQLAAALAKYVLGASSTEARKKLALGWIATGSVDSLGQIHSVYIGAKQKIFEKENQQGHRRILIPRENETQPWEKELHPSPYHVESVKEAIRLLEETGFFQSHIQLPEKIRCLHVLVGKNHSPVKIPIFLLGPQHVILWASADTRQHAEEIKKEIEVFPSCAKIKIRIRELSSSDLAEGYTAFTQGLEEERMSDSPQDSGEDMISFTGGNRLMGIVAVQVGFDQGMKLVYRDIDSLWHQLKVLEKREGKYYTDILECQPSIELSDEEWSKLYKKG